MGKSSMSLMTSLSLSFNNLKSKKARTLLTSFAGSIGIIGIALILSISNGVNTYITDIQKSTMSSYPISIESQAVDLTSIMSSGHEAMHNQQDGKVDHKLDAVYSNNIGLEMASSMTTSITENNLTEFKKYLDNWETHLKRTFGKDSREAKLFKSAQNYEYDNHMEYRIFYRLRNYDQHCDNFVSRITGRILPNESHEYLVLADRDRLLKDFAEWKPDEIAYLQSCDKYFDIRPLLSVFQNCIMLKNKDYMKTLYCDSDGRIKDTSELLSELYEMILQC
jgi:hypothetical protein